jgi:hydroxyacylglutathione hydrolase
VFFRQIQQHSDNFTYLIADQRTHDAAVVDSSYNADETIKIVKEQCLNLKYVISTHGHSDHTAGNAELKSVFGAKLVAYASSRIQSDIKVNDGDELNVGDVRLKIIHTPGHTADSICILVDDKKLLTGDTLFVGECGRTDMPGGNSHAMFDSLFGKVLSLSDDVEVYPGHDYGATPSSTIGRERRTNYTLKPRTLKEFMDFMSQP